MLKTKRFYTNSVILKFIIIFLSLLFLPIVFLLIFTQDKINYIEKESADQFLSSNLKTVSGTVDQILQNAEFSYTSLFMNKVFTNSLILLSPYDLRDEYSDYFNTNNIKEQLSNMTLSNKNIKSIYAYSYLANRMFSSGTNWNSSFNHYNLDQSDWYSSFQEKKEDEPWTIAKSVDSDTNILTSYRELQEFKSNKKIALLSINVNISIITNLLQDVNISDSGYCYMMDNRQNMITSNIMDKDPAYKLIADAIPSKKQQGFFDVNLEKEKLFVSFYTSPYSKMTYIVAAPLKDIETVTPILSGLTVLYIIIIAIIMLLSVFLAYFYLFSPIKILFKGMKEVENGNFKVRLPKNSSYEINYINKHFNNMTGNIEKLIEENYINLLISKEAKLEAIQSQLNEHFLYNTLDSIHWMAREENAPRACDMIYSLANFYRLSLSSGNDFIPINQVKDILDNYLHIQKIRMGEAFTYVMHCDKTLSDHRVLKYLFQPIVENAIVHGLKNSTHPVFIEISFTQKDSYLCFLVKDNGCGINASKLKIIQQQLDQDELYQEENFALKTIYSQLQLQYGSKSSLHIESIEFSGCSIWINIPIEKLEDWNHVENDNCR